MSAAEHLRGPWLAMLEDRDGAVYPTWEMARKELDDGVEMTISIVRDTAMPFDGGDPENLRLPGSYNAGDIAHETDAYLVDDDDPSLGAEAQYARAQAMADGLNRAAEDAEADRNDVLDRDVR